MSLKSCSSTDWMLDWCNHFKLLLVSNFTVIQSSLQWPQPKVWDFADHRI